MIHRIFIFSYRLQYKVYYKHLTVRTEDSVAVLHDMLQSHCKSTIEVLVQNMNEYLFITPSLVNQNVTQRKKQMIQHF